MQVNHRHIPEAIRSNKRRWAISESNPLILVISSDFSFLSILAQTILKYYCYPVRVQQCQGRTLMDYIPPLLCYQNAILSQQSLIQFLCDVALGNQELEQFIARKENVRRVFRAWRQIFQGDEERVGKSDLELLTKHHHSTNVYQELMLLTRDVVNRGYQRLFLSYRPERLNIEAVLMIDITHTILKHCPRDTCDLLLRGGFPAIIDFQPDYIQRHLKEKEEEYLQGRMEEDLRGRMEEPDMVFVLLDGKAPDEPNHPKVNLNLKWFSGVLVGLAFIFGKWAH